MGGFFGEGAEVEVVGVVGADQDEEAVEGFLVLGRVTREVAAVRLFEGR